MGNEGGLAGAMRKSPQILELEEKKREKKLNSKATLSENCSFKKKHHREEHRAPPCKRSRMKKQIDDLIFSFVAENPSDQDGEQYPSYGETAMKNDQHPPISSEQRKPEITLLESQSLMKRRGPELLGKVKCWRTRVGRPPKIGPSPLGPRRDVGNWNRFSSGKEPLVPAVYNAPKTLEANKDENCGFKESCLHYIKDLGPKAQVAASKKLIKCASQAPSSSQTPSIPTKQTERPPVLHVTPGLQRPPHLDGSAYCAQIPTTTPHNLSSRSNFSPSNYPFGILGQAFAEANARVSGGVKIQEPSNHGQEMNSLSIENVNALNPSKEGMHQFSYLLGKKYNAAKGIDSGKNALKGRIVAETDIDYEDIFGSYPTRNDDFLKTVTSQNQTSSIPTKQTEIPLVLHVTPGLQQPPHPNGSAYHAQIPTTTPRNLPSGSNFSPSNNPFGILGQAFAEANARVSGGIKIQEPSDFGQEMNSLSIDIDYEDIFGFCPAKSFTELLLGNYDDSQVTVTSQNQTPSIPTKQTEGPPVLHVTPGLQRPPHLDGSANRAQIHTATPHNLLSRSKFSPAINPFGILGQAFAEANAHVSGGVKIQEPSDRGHDEQSQY